MFHKVQEIIYYVSHLNTGVISIIDGHKFSIINELEVDPRPYNIIVDEKNKLYIASDRNNKITIINDLYDHTKTLNIPNNGNIQVDCIDQRIYVCDTEEVCIYSLITGEKIHCITGFIAADCLRLDKRKKRLFVLDILQNEINVYDISDFCLIKKYRDVGIGPNYIAIGEDEKEVYIANKGVYRGNYSGNISILNIDTGNISYINLQKGSVITALEQSKNFIYAVNSGLNRIEVIDISKKESIAIIKTTLPELQRLRLSPDKKTLLVTSRNIDGKGVLDIIDITSKTIIDTVIFEHKNSIPYDIGILFQSNQKLEEESFILYHSKEIYQPKEETAILAKMILSNYQEKIIFSEVLIKIPYKEQVNVTIDNIVFHQCKMIEKTKIRKVLEHRKDYSTLQYDFYIPYYFDLKDENGEKYVLEGSLVGTQKATLYIPDYAEQQGVQFLIKSFTNLISTPVIINYKLKFSVSVLISTKVIVEEMVLIPNCKECKWNQKRNGCEEEKHE